jgi:hypothetical protein
MGAKTQRKGIFDSPAVVTARRALGITKTYIAMTVVFALIAITLWGNVMYSNIGTGTASNSTASNALGSNAIRNVSVAGKGLKASHGVPLLAVPLNMVPLMMLATPVLLLFVYDKNNGVLEYLLSLGMTHREIYMRYLKAAIMLTLIFSVIFVPATLAYGYAVYGASAVATILPIPLLEVPFSLAVVSFMVITMMAFSSLQKPRAGSNQPLGLIIGWLITLPAYMVPFVFTFKKGIYADLAIAAMIAFAVFAFLRSSEKLIRGEKFLP